VKFVVLNCCMSSYGGHEPVFSPPAGGGGLEARGRSPLAAVGGGPLSDGGAPVLVSAGAEVGDGEGEGDGEDEGDGEGEGDGGEGEGDAAAAGEGDAAAAGEGDGSCPRIATGDSSSKHKARPICIIFMQSASYQLSGYQLSGGCAKLWPASNRGQGSQRETVILGCCARLHLSSRGQVAAVPALTDETQGDQAFNATLWRAHSCARKRNVIVSEISDWDSPVKL